jgi:hypothetical protein
MQKFYLIIIFIIVTSCSREAKGNRKDKFEAAKVKGIEFLDKIKVYINPITMNKDSKMNYKKHLVEYVSTYLTFYETTRSIEEKALYKRKVEEIIAPVYTSEYHNFANSSLEEFKDNVVSYLNAGRILQKFGFDTKMYKEKIRKILPLIISKEHQDTRKLTNNMAIRLHLDELGFNGGYSYVELYQNPECIIRTHPNIEGLNLYSLTHEIFYLTNFGTTGVKCATSSDLTYLRRIFLKLIPKGIEMNNPDLVAELLICLHYIGLKNTKEYNEAVDYLFSCQNLDGSWGNYEKLKKEVENFNPAYIVEASQYLHTTHVALWALSLVFD